MVRGVEGINNNIDCLGNTESENSGSEIGLDTTAVINMNVSMSDDASLPISSCTCNILDNSNEQIDVEETNFVLNELRAKNWKGLLLLI